MISEAELEKLFEIMRYYIGKGFTFLYVSYHLEVQMSRAILMSEGSINLILDQQQIQKGISKNLYIDFYNHVRQRMRHRARGLDNCSNSHRKEVLYVKDITRKGFRHFQFSVYEGECLVIQSLDTKMYRETHGESWRRKTA